MCKWTSKCSPSQRLQTRNDFCDIDIDLIRVFWLVFVRGSNTFVCDSGRTFICRCPAFVSRDQTCMRVVASCATIVFICKTHFNGQSRSKQENYCYVTATLGLPSKSNLSYTLSNKQKTKNSSVRFLIENIRFIVQNNRAIKNRSRVRQDILIKKKVFMSLNYKYCGMKVEL